MPFLDSLAVTEFRVDLTSARVLAGTLMPASNNRIIDQVGQTRADDKHPASQLSVSMTPSLHSPSQAPSLLFSNTQTPSNSLLTASTPPSAAATGTANSPANSTFSSLPSNLTFARTFSSASKYVAHSPDLNSCVTYSRSASLQPASSRRWRSAVWMRAMPPLESSASVIWSWSVFAVWGVAAGGMEALETGILGGLAMVLL